MENQAITPDKAIAAIANHTTFNIFLICKPFVDITIYSKNIIVQIALNFSINRCSLK